MNMNIRRSRFLRSRIRGAVFVHTCILCTLELLVAGNDGSPHFSLSSMGGNGQGVDSVGLLLLY